MSSEISAPIAIVTPWYGEQLKGGAEQHAWNLATRLARRGHRVEVLTTCCAAFLDDWAANTLPPGDEMVAGVLVRRFPVEARDVQAFAWANGCLLGLPEERLRPRAAAIDGDVEAAFFQHNIRSAALSQHLRRHGQTYAAVIFLPYLYGVVTDGIEAMAGGTILLNPCLHDEAYAYLPRIAGLFDRATRVLFLSEGERELAARLYGPAIAGKSVMVGAGTEWAALPDDNSRSLHPLLPAGQPFMLYLGRRDRGKNVDFLVSAWRQAGLGSACTLVIAGPGRADVDYTAAEAGILDLGLLSEADKALALHRCIALLQPSENESYSRVIMEAWFERRPVIVHANCLATAMAVDRSGGGLKADGPAAWVDAILHLLEIGVEGRQAFGLRGEAYARVYADWDAVIANYEAQIAALPVAVPPVLRQVPGVTQLLTAIRHGDAVSEEALWIDARLREFGIRSRILAEHIHPALLDRVRPAQEAHLDPADALIYHHSIGAAATMLAIRHPGPKGMIYHNITPGDYFRPYNSIMAAMLDKGRRELADLAAAMPVSVGDSAYNAEELACAGFQAPGVLPICIDPGKWSRPPAADLLARLDDGVTNLLFVGRMAPNKRQDELVELFAQYRRLNPNSRLILVGHYNPDDMYFVFVQEKVDGLNLREAVVFLSGIDDSQLRAVFETADAFVSLSEHEGFCVPLVEAMWFDIPILAYSSSAIPATLGRAGILVDDKSDLRKLAALLHLMLTCEPVADQVLVAQRERRQAFVSTAIVPEMLKFIAAVVCAAPSQAEKTSNYAQG